MGRTAKESQQYKDAIKIGERFTMVPFPVFAVKIWPVMLGELSLLQAYISAAVLHSSSYSIGENNAIHNENEAKVRIRIELQVSYWLKAVCNGTGALAVASSSIRSVSIGTNALS